MKNKNDKNQKVTIKLFYNVIYVESSSISPELFVVAITCMT